MFDFVHKKRRVVQIIMGLAVLPFLFWGLESYQSNEGGDFVATAAGEKIQRQEFDQAMRNQQESMRATMGENFNDTILERPEVRSAVLEGLIQQRLLKHEASRVGLAISDEQLVEMIQNISAFQEDGKFSKQRYEELLRGQGMTPRAFEARVRQELMRQQLTSPYSENGFVSDTVAEKLMRLSEEQREISLVQILPSEFLAQVQPDDSAIKTYYEAHQAEFQVPEQAQVEYVVLSLEGLAEKSPVSFEEAMKYFEEHKSEFGQTEERRASHILLSAPASASDADRQAARTKAEQILAQVRKAPQTFAELAKQHSQDPGSAANGGDLGFFGRNMMVKAFEDTVFNMKPDEISDIVETDFGFHIIKLTAIKDAKPVDFNEVRTQVEQQIKKEKAGKLFGEMADAFSNVVYEQSDSLQPAAEKFSLPIRRSGWIGRDAGEPPYLTNGRLLQAIFSEDALKNKRNTEAVEVAPNTLVAARVLEHRPTRLPSVEELKNKISGLLAQREARARAIKEGQEKLAKLRGGRDSGLPWGSVKLVSRKDPQGLDNEILRATFRTDTALLPSYGGVENSQGGFTLIRVSRVIKPEMPDVATRRAFAKQLQQLLTQEELSSYLNGVRKRYDVSVGSVN